MMRNRDEIRTEVKTTLARLSGGATFDDAADVFEAGVVRSMNLIELIVCVEDTYGLVISQADVFAGHLRSVDRLVAFVVQHGAAS